MSFVRAFDKKGPLRQSIEIDYAILKLMPGSVRKDFREYVKLEYAVLKNSILANQPIISGDMFNGWKFKMSLVGFKIVVKITNKVSYSNYITSGSQIYDGNPFLEAAMAEFELDVLTTMIQLGR